MAVELPLIPRRAQLPVSGVVDAFCCLKRLIFEKTEAIGIRRDLMKYCLPKRLQGVVLLLVCLASGAWADQLKIVNAGANYVMGGVYTSPYGITVNGGAPVMLICDDFTTEISLGQTWSATATSFAQLQAGTNPAGTPKFGSAILTVGDLQNYATAAVLAAQLMALPNLASEAAGEISYALWGIFDAPLLTSIHNPFGTITPLELSAATDYLSAARVLVANVTSGNTVNLNQISIGGRAIAGMTIYTPNPLNASQEFLMVSMPEPSYPAVLAMDLLGILGLIVVFRRRITGIFN